MPLTPGEKLGPYEITSLIGKGGMGEVFKARDSRLNRDVAIKVSREQFSERFEREARAVAALNHPNVCTLYDVGPNYLVMEFVEGESPKGPLPVEEALRIAHQVTDALEAAHEKNITHRDLKPGNIMIRPDGMVKVLDFGLAKVGRTATSDGSEQATVTLGATQAGSILGTPAYMAPEQAKGRTDVDKRADIWAFGVVFYELLTGERLFSGDDLTEVLAAVVLKEPSFEKAPVEFRRLLKKCLEKDVKKRLRDIADVWDLVEVAPAEIPAMTGGAGVVGGVGRGKVAWGVAALALIAAGALAAVHFREAPPPAPALVRFSIPMPDKVVFGGQLSFSPDGRYVVYRGQGDGGNRLWLHSLDTLESRPLSGTEGATNAPFWSPDSRSIVFGAQNRLMKVSVSGGPPIKICDTSGNPAIGFWTPENRIVFASIGSAILEVLAGGGTPKPLTKLAEGETQHGPGALLPDGNHYLYLVRGTNPERTGVYVHALNAKPGEERRLLPDDTSAFYSAPANGASGPGQLVFVRDATLMAQPFDAARLEFVGDPAPVAQGVGNLAGFSVSKTGALAYGSVGAGGSRQLAWYDRKGLRLETVWKPNSFNEIELSPDGSRVAAVINPSSTDTWVYEFARKAETQISSAGVHAVWSPDGQRLVYGNPNGTQLYTRAANAADSEQLLAKVESGNVYPQSWPRDGRFLLFVEQSAKTGQDLMVLPLEAGKAGKPTVYLNSEANERQGQFSPDGRLVAYSSGQQGRTEIYVSTFPDPAAGKWTISNGGGFQPRWRRDGKELFYFTGDGKLMSVEVKPGPSFGVPKELFQAPIYGGGGTPAQIRWDVTADGQKFLINTVAGDTSAPLTVVLNWQAGLQPATTQP